MKMRSIEGNYKYYSFLPKYLQNTLESHLCIITTQDKNFTIIFKQIRINVT